MEIRAKVVPGAKRDLIRKEGTAYKIYLTAPPVEGKANKALVRFLSEHFQVAKSHIEITKGLKSRHKTISINDNPTCGTK